MDNIENEIELTDSQTPTDGGEGQNDETQANDETPSQPPANNEPPSPAEPNVIFIGTRRVQGKKVRSEKAPQILIDGPRRFEDLPSSEQQIEGFYYERAAELCRAFPGLYKRFKNKGE